MKEIYSKLFKAALLGIFGAAAYLVSEGKLDYLFEQKPKIEHRRFFVFQKEGYRSYVIDFYNPCLTKTDDICDNLTGYYQGAIGGEIRLELKFTESCEKKIDFYANNHRFDASIPINHFEGKNGYELFRSAKQKCIEDKLNFVHEEKYYRMREEYSKKAELDRKVNEIMKQPTRQLKK